MNLECQMMAANAIAHEANMARRAIQNAASQYERPCVLYKPRLIIDGNRWCALYGDNLQDGVAGFGDSPEAAMWAFDQEWNKELVP